MEIDRFKLIVEAYGASPARWPLGEREAAMTLLARDVRAAAIVACAEGLDQLLDRVRASAPGAALTARIMATAPKPRRGLRAIVGEFFPDRPIWQPVLGLSLALVLGAGVGVAYPVSAPYAPGADTQGLTLADDDALLFIDGNDISDNGEDRS